MHKEVIAQHRWRGETLGTPLNQGGDSANVQQLLQPKTQSGPALTGAPGIATPAGGAPKARTGRRASRRIRLLLIAGLALSNLLIWAFSAYSLQQAKQRDEDAARALTRNITHAVDQSVAKTAARIDMALLAVVDELERQLAGKGIDAKASTALLDIQEQRVPEVGAIRVSDADGALILGKGVSPSNPKSWADHPLFATLRQQASAGMKIYGPVPGRVSTGMVLPFGRRYNHPDGRFAGIVAAATPQTHFEQLLAPFASGKTSILTLRDAELGLIARAPVAPDIPSGVVGNHVVPQEFRTAFESGAPTATGTTAAGPDGIQRIFTFRRLEKAPMVATAALSSQDYLQGWESDALRTAGIAAAFGLLSIFFGVALIRQLNQGDADLRALVQHRAFVTSILDSLTEHVAVIDGQGVITAVNAAWQRFAAENGTDLAAVTVGANYLQVCGKASGTPGGTEGEEALAGIRAVLDGSQAEFSIEYPCHSTTQQRWFVLRGINLVGQERGAVLIHQNVTYRHEAEARLRTSEEHFRLLAENMEDVVWKADCNMVFTYINDADRRLRGFPQAAVVGHPIEDTLTDEGRTLLARDSQEQLQKERKGEKGRARHFELPQRRADGGEVWIEVMSIPVFDATGRISGFQGICRDITERKAMQAKLEHAKQALEVQLRTIASEHRELREEANRDPLTGVHNRRYLDEALPQELARAKHGRYPVAVIMVDLDHFKRVNDNHSHIVGDAVLKALASLLTEGSRESDIVCRYGGEEFVLVVPTLGPALALKRMEALRKKLEGMRIPHGTVEVSVTFSAGIAIFPQHGDSMDTLLARADEMLYRSKREGRNRITLYGA